MVSVLIHFSIPLVIATSIPKVLLPVPVHPLIRTSCWAGKPFFALLIIVLNESISIMIDNNSNDSNDIIVIKKIVITTTTTTTTSTIDTVTTTTNRPNYKLSMHSKPLFWVLTPQHYQQLINTITTVTDKDHIFKSCSRLHTEMRVSLRVR